MGNHLFGVWTKYPSRESRRTSAAKACCRSFVPKCSINELEKTTSKVASANGADKASAMTESWWPYGQSGSRFTKVTRGHTSNESQVGAAPPKSTTFVLSSTANDRTNNATRFRLNRRPKTAYM